MDAKDRKEMPAPRQPYPADSKQNLLEHEIMATVQIRTEKPEIKT